MKKYYQGSMLHDANIYHKDGHIDGAMLGKYLDELLINGDLATLEGIITTLENSEHLPDGHRVRINSIKNAIAVFKKEFNELIELDKQIPVSLTPYNSNPVQLKDVNADICKMLPPMLYKFGAFNGSVSTFDADFEGMPSIVNRLKMYGFDKKIPSENAFLFRVMKDVDIHTENRNFFAYVQGVFFDRNNSGRLTKKTNKTTIKQNIKTIAEAVLLPIPHSTRNYYHVLSEMIYSLSRLKHFDNSIPVIYCEDRFNILPDICEKLNININRFFSFDDISDSRVLRAYSLLSFNFFWDKDFFNFFKQICPNSHASNKVYISRRKSVRSLSNEIEVEEFLCAHGFDVIFAEELTFKEQVMIFSNAKVLMSCHGAGLSNIAFMNSGTTIVEIFTDHAIVEHYYLRSRHNNMKYIPIFAEGNKIKTHDLIGAISNIINEKN